MSADRGDGWVTIRVKRPKPTRQQREALVRLGERALEEARKQLREYDAG